MAALTGSPNQRPSEFAEGSEDLVNNRYTSYSLLICKTGATTRESVNKLSL